MVECCHKVGNILRAVNYVEPFLALKLFGNIGKVGTENAVYDSCRIRFIELFKAGSK